MQPLHVSRNRRYLETAEGKPFFYRGDTAWELFHRLDRGEAETYLRARGEQGFNVVQAVALAEIDGLRTPNAYGRVPLKTGKDGAFDPTLPDTDGDYSYWDHVDFVVDTAAKCGLFIGFLPTWGDKYNLKWGDGPEIFTPENARAYGVWLGRRYRDRDNIIWILGGDRPLETPLHYAIVDAMAEGLREGDGGKFLITFHPCGRNTSTAFVHDRPWLDFNMAQSSHGRNAKSYELIAEGYNRHDVKPMMDGEPCYEDHPINMQYGEGFFDAFNVRNALYWNTFSGACGNTYGHYCCWCMTKEDGRCGVMDWEDAVHRPGAENERIFADFIRNYPPHLGVPDEAVVKDNHHDNNFKATLVSENYVLIYVPNGLAFSLRREKVAAYPRARLFNPRTGEYSAFDGIGEDLRVRLPSKGRGEDWVLILEK